MYVTHVSLDCPHTLCCTLIYVCLSVCAYVCSTQTWHECYDSETGGGLAAPGFLSWNTLGATVQVNLASGINPFSLDTASVSPLPLPFSLSALSTSSIEAQRKESGWQKRQGKAETNKSKASYQVMITEYADAQCPCSAQFVADVKQYILDVPEFQPLVNFQQYFVPSCMNGFNHCPPDNLSSPVWTECIHGAEECVGQS